MSEDKGRPVLPHRSGGGYQPDAPASGHMQIAVRAASRAYTESMRQGGNGDEHMAAAVSAALSVPAAPAVAPERVSVPSNYFDPSTAKLPPAGSALQKLGEYLSTLLDEDRWATAEQYLFAAVAEAAESLPDSMTTLKPTDPVEMTRAQANAYLASMKLLGLEPHEYLPDAIRRLQSTYEAAVKGRADFRDALRAERAERAAESVAQEGVPEGWRDALTQCVLALEFAHQKSGVVQGLPSIVEAISAGRAMLTAAPVIPQQTAADTERDGGSLLTSLSQTIAECDDALRALADRDARQQWQPIETAPKDGTRVLLWGADFIAPHTGAFYGLRGWYPSYDQGPFADQPTHWMPLPAAPTAGER